MILQEIIMADCTAIVLLLILLISRYLVRRNTRTEDRFFYALCSIGFVATTMELIAFLIDGHSGGFVKFANIFVNAVIYACTTTISILWLWYVDSSLNHDTKRIRTVFLPFVIVYGILMVMLVVNVFTGFLYVIDENNVYSRRPLGYIYYAFLFICFITTFVIYIRDRITYGETKFFPIFMFLIPVIAGCIIQALWYGIACAWLSCAVGLTAIYLNIQSRFAFIDGLTGLYNRAFIEHKLIIARKKSSHYAYCGIMLDIDSFKQINDNFGHSVGDDALRQTAAILKEAADRKTLLFRFAGDEFIILHKVPLSEKDKLEQIMVDLEQKIIEGAEKFNKTNTNYQLRFSFGNSLFDSKLDDDEFFRQMDLEMYKQKKLHHELEKQN